MSGSDFSSLGKTWTKQSSLGGDLGWDPYPELQNPANCYGANTQENYNGDQSCANYNNGMNMGRPSADFINYNLAKSSTVMAGLRAPMRGMTGPRESYQDTKNYGVYSGLNKTWGAQKPFTL